MNEIIINNLNGSLTVSSLQVAKDFEKRHDKLVTEIERMYGELIGCAQNGGDPFFWTIVNKVDRKREKINKDFQIEQVIKGY